MKKRPHSQSMDSVATALHNDNFQAIRDWGESVCESLIQIAQGSDEHLASKAIVSLGSIDRDECCPSIEMAAKSRRATLRIAAAVAAGELSPHRAEPILLRLLKSKDIGVQTTAIRVAKTVGTPRLDAVLKKVQSNKAKGSGRQSSVTEINRRLATDWKKIGNIHPN